MPVARSGPIPSMAAHPKAPPREPGQAALLGLPEALQRLAASQQEAAALRGAVAERDAALAQLRAERDQLRGMLRSAQRAILASAGAGARRDMKLDLTHAALSTFLRAAESDGSPPRDDMPPLQEPGADGREPSPAAAVVCSSAAVAAALRRQLAPGAGAPPRTPPPHPTTDPPAAAPPAAPAEPRSPRPSPLPVLLCRGDAAERWGLLLDVSLLLTGVSDASPAAADPAVRRRVGWRLTDVGGKGVSTPADVAVACGGVLQCSFTFAPPDSPHDAVRAALGELSLPPSAVPGAGGRAA